jgi:hypothetical protein
MVKEVETNRLIPLYTPLFFGWTISLIVIMYESGGIDRMVGNQLPKTA